MAASGSRGLGRFLAMSPGARRGPSSGRQATKSTCIGNHMPETPRTKAVNDTINRDEVVVARDMRDVALAESRGCIIEEVHFSDQPIRYYWRKGMRCSAD